MTVDTSDKDIPEELHHYTSDKGRHGIVETKEIWPSLKSNNPKDARYGDGQYLSDIAPNTLTKTQLSHRFYGMPYRSDSCSNYVTINVEGLTVENGRENVYLIPNNKALDVSDRLVDDGVNTK